VLDITPDGQQVAGAWFTYTPIKADLSSEQRWYAFQGALGDVGTPVDLQMFAPAQGRFVSDGAASNAPVGRIKLALHGCDSLLMTYEFEAGELQGTQGAVQLRRTAGTGNCAGGNDTLAAPTDGAWYDPDTSGQGISLQTVPGDGAGLLVGGWFTFDPEGAVDDPLAQHWFSLIGAKSSESSATDMIIYRTIGGAFDRQGTNNTHAVGRARFTAASCRQADFEYAFDQSDVAGRFAGLNGTIPAVNLLGCAQ
jgi:hypothetical protein